MAREGIANVSGIFALVVVFSYLAWIAGRNVTDASPLIVLAVTLPREIDLSCNVHVLAAGWNDLLAVWTRLTGACAAMQPAPDACFDQRIRFEGVALSVSGSEGQMAVVCASVDDALARIRAQPQGRLLIRGNNGSGKSTLLAALKARLGARAFYCPTSDRMAFAFSGACVGALADEGDDESVASVFSSDERQLKSLQEIVSGTHAAFYLLDEWDANLEAKNRASAEALVATLAARTVVVEISHRDRV